MSKTQSDRDFANVRHFVARSSGMRYYAPSMYAPPNAIKCSCWVDKQTGIQSCACAPMMTSDMLFAREQVGGGVRQTIRFSSPCERSAAKYRQRIMAQSTA